MEIVVLKMLFIVSVSAEQFRKHVYMQDAADWHNAQQQCRKHYTDLSPITTRREERKLNATTGKVDGEMWIGLHRVGAQWKWSGGGNATNIPWAALQPDNLDNQKVASVCWHKCKWKGWHDIPPETKLPFLCLNLIVIKYKRTWEQAWGYCRKNHIHLTSLISETEHLLAQKEIQEVHITERVWIGLRYLEDRWLWVNRDPLEYQAWSQGDQDHQCPIQKRCGALTKDGLWENWDCQDKLNFICY